MLKNFTREKIQAVLTRMRVLEILVDGCKKHPAYRAKNPPRKDDCKSCQKMWNARQQLKQTEVILDGLFE